MKQKIISTLNRKYVCELCKYETRLKYVAKEHLYKEHFEDIFTLHENITIK